MRITDEVQSSADVMAKMNRFMEELVRYLGMRFVLSPAAYMLPRSLAMATAGCLSLFLLVLPTTGAKTYWDFRLAFGRGRLDSLALTLRWLARPFRDYIVFKRSLFGREDASKKRIVERNADGVNELRRSGVSYIVATAHFTREALFALYAPDITKGCAFGLSHLPKEKARRLEELRIRLQLETLIKASAHWRQDHEVIPVGTGCFPFARICRRLQKPGTVVIIHVDAAWARQERQTGWYQRPFAAHRKRVFATGAADLALVARRPVVSCAYFIEDDGTAVLDWGSPVVPNHNGCGTNTQIMDVLIDRLEIAVGERPAQYVLSVGSDRRWNGDKKRWESLPAAVGA